MAASEGRGFADAGAVHSKNPTHINKDMRMQGGVADCMVQIGAGGEGRCRGRVVQLDDSDEREGVPARRGVG
jgi:hypothetical protein